MVIAAGGLAIAVGKAVVCAAAHFLWIFFEVGSVAVSVDRTGAGCASG